MDTLGYLGTGICHEKEGIPCQDALGSRNMENGNRVWALSDGAGSAAFAAQASWGNVKAVMDFFEGHPLASFLLLPEQEQKEALLGACREALEKSSEEFAERPWDFSATLLFFVWDGTHWLAGHLGDGFLTVIDREGTAIITSEPDNWGNRSGTWFTVSLDAGEHLRLYTDPARLPGQLLMVSDGPCAMFRTRSCSHFETAAELLGYVRQGDITSAQTLAEVLDQMTYYAYDRRDDWSVLIWSAEADFESQDGITARSMLAQEMEKMKVEQRGETENG